MTIRKSEYKNIPDEKLMVLVRKHDNSALGEIYDRYADRLLLLLRRMLGNDNEKARDFLQEIFIRVLRSADRFEQDRNFRTWIYTIAMNLCKNEYRRMNVHRPKNVETPVAELPNRAIDPDNAVDLTLFNQALEAELNKLPVYLRSTFLLRFQNGLTIREIADIMNCAPGTVKSRLFYLIKNLAAALEPYNPYNIEAV